MIRESKRLAENEIECEKKVNVVQKGDSECETKITGRVSSLSLWVAFLTWMVELKNK